MWSSLCEADATERIDPQPVTRDWLVQFNPTTNRAHIIFSVPSSAVISDIRVKGVESNGLTALSVQWEEDACFFLQTISIDASLNTSIGNCYCCVRPPFLIHLQSGYFVVDLNVRHFCELIRHHDDVLSPMLVSLSLSPHRRTTSAIVSAPRATSPALAVDIPLSKASVASLARPLLAGAICAK